MANIPQAEHVAATRWLSFRNDSDETAPPFAAMRITGAVLDVIPDQLVITVDKPNRDSDPGVLFNGPSEVPAGAFGSGTLDFPLMAAYDTADGTPAVLDDYGTAEGSWLLKKDKTGFSILGGHHEGRVLVQRSGTAATPALITFELTETLGATGAAKLLSIIMGDVPTEEEGDTFIVVRNTEGLFSGGAELKGKAIRLPDGTYEILVLECVEEEE